MCRRKSDPRGPYISGSFRCTASRLRDARRGLTVAIRNGDKARETRYAALVTELYAEQTTAQRPSPPADAQPTWVAEGHRPLRDGARLDALDAGFPETVYQSPELYGLEGTPAARARLAQLLRSLRGRPDATVTIYRALPADGEARIFEGDWVALDREYAEAHAAKISGEQSVEMRVVELTVPAAAVRNGGNDLTEWGYWPGHADQAGAYWGE